jgi:hypothetical protein
MERLLGWLRDTVAGREAVPSMSERLATGDHLGRMFAVAAACRTGERGRSVLERAAVMEDDDLRVFASREIAAARD